MDCDSNEGNITVNLVKRKTSGLGFLAVKQDASPYLAVSQIVKGGVAHETGFIETGDVILEVNGTSLESVPYFTALDIFEKIPIGETAVLTIRAQDGFQAYLETAFDKEGIVKTVRTTRPITSKGTEMNGNVNGETQELKHAMKKETVLSTEKEKHVVHEAPPTNNGVTDKEQPENENRGESTNNKKCPVTNASPAKPQQPKYVKLKYLIDGSCTTDTLHQKSLDPIHCTKGRCLGSLMYPSGGEAPPKRPYGVPRPPEEVMADAKDFLEQYYGSMKLGDSPAHQQRLAEVMKEIEKTGTYDITEKELIYGCKMAWRNATRCIGRIQWNKLQVFDARDVNTAAEMFEAICRHIEYATNKGNLRSAITVFPQRRTAHQDFRVWNAQMISYAGYRQPDGSCIGDPSKIEFTEMCEALGWEGKGGRFDVLPLILQAHGGYPEFFDIPPELILEVEIKHPKFPWFEELGLKWYAVPGVSCQCLDIGGVEMTACPFSGWYMVTEIGSRDLADPNRYNMLEPVAKRMGLDTKSHTSLWKDIAMVEMNLAVLYSFQEAGVTITDHHSASESYMKHVENEVKLRGGCPGDWVWIVPPMSGSATSVFHLEMLNYTLKPGYVYQDDPWKYCALRKEDADSFGKRKATFKEVAEAVKFSAKLMMRALAKRQKAVILYATETGKSERYAKMLGELFSHAFDPKVIRMDEYSYPDIENEQLVLIVTSTFGNGDPPENGEGFARFLYELRHPTNGSRSMRNKLKQLGSLLVQKEKEKYINMKDDSQPLANLRYSVFGLGSKAYPNFCAFARSLDKIIQELGGEPVLKMGEGDELCGQEESFKDWTKEVFQAACDSFCISDDVTKKATQTLDSMPSGWEPGRFRITKSAAAHDGDNQLAKGLSHVCGKPVRSSTLLSVTNLQSADSRRSTILVKFKTEKNSELQYKPGDHLAIFAANRPTLVQDLIDNLSDGVDPDLPIVLEVMREVEGSDGTSQVWEPFSRLPSPITVREALSRYLDITNVPSPQIIKFLATMANDKEEKERLQLLGEGSNRYEDWKFEKELNILEVLQDFPSLQVPADLLLTQLPLLQPRFYSISSSPDLFPGEVHLTVAVVRYNKRGGMGPLHHGVCSTWLNDLQAGDKVPCYVRQANTFHMPEDGTVPIIMVGPGTGIAPFRSFWQQRQFDITNKAAPRPKALDVTPDSSPLPTRRQMFPSTGSNLLNSFTGKWGSMQLYFGCRNSQQEYIYKDEMAKAKDDGALTEIRLALSREPQQPKTYVQDLLKEDEFDVCEKLLSQKAHFYVCGDVKMADGVCKTLQVLLQEYAAMSQEEAQETIDKLKSTGRYHEDIFGVTLKTREVTTSVRSAAKRSVVCFKNPITVKTKRSTSSGY